QGVADGLPALPPEPPLPANSGCPADMALVDGGFLLDEKGREDTDEVLVAQNATCTFFRTGDHGVNALCDRFDADAWRARAAKLPKKPLRFCIDRYEYPNARGEFPLVVVT